MRRSRAVAFGRTIAHAAPLLCVALCARSAAAQEPPLTRLEYRVPEGCPPVAEFERRVHLRSARIQFASGAAPRSLHVEITTSGAASVGTLRLIEGDGNDRRRGFQATTCEDAVDGLALIAAVALDPEGASGLAPQPPPPAPPPSPPPPTPAPRMLGPEASSVAPVTLHLRDVSFGAGGSAIFGLLPDAVGGVHIFGQLDFDYRGSLAPAVRLSATFFPTDHKVSGPAGNAIFSIIAPRLEICPLRIGSSEANVRPCISGTVAIVKSEGGVDTQRASPETNAIWVPGLSANVALRIWGPIDAFGSAGVGIPTSRYQYVFRAHDPSQPPIELFSTSKTVDYAGAGLAAELP